MSIMDYERLILTSGWQGKVEMIRRVTTAKGRARSGYFSIEGLRLHERALRAGMPLTQAIVAQRFLAATVVRAQKLLADLQTVGCMVTAVPDAVMDDLTAGRDLGGIIGLVKMPPKPKLSQLVAIHNRHQAVFLVAVDVVDPGNVGALVRTAHAAGATGFMAVGVSDPFHPRALRTTMGSLFKLPILRYDALDALLLDLRENGVLTVGTAVAEAIPLPQASFKVHALAVLMGSEAYGLPAAALKAVDKRVTIPMAEGVDSYSVNAAAAIVLYEINQQRLRSSTSPGS